MATAEVAQIPTAKVVRKDEPASWLPGPTSWPPEPTSWVPKLAFWPLFYRYPGRKPTCRSAPGRHKQRHKQPIRRDGSIRNSHPNVSKPIVPSITQQEPMSGGGQTDDHRTTGPLTLKLASTMGIYHRFQPDLITLLLYLVPFPNAPSGLSRHQGRVNRDYVVLRCGVSGTEKMGCHWNTVRRDESEKDRSQ